MISIRRLAQTPALWSLRFRGWRISACLRSSVFLHRGRFGSDSFQIIDDWDADLCAVGIALPQDASKVVYISTYGLPTGRYSCHVDIWPTPGSDSNYKSIAKSERIDFAGLVTAITEHLGLSGGADIVV